MGEASARNGFFLLFSSASLDVIRFDLKPGRHPIRPEAPGGLGSWRPGIDEPLKTYNKNFIHFTR
jgi:hypothetical protein